jgi:hypothetical protein
MQTPTTARCVTPNRRACNCHRSEPPESHNVFWHLRGHGIAAMIDRENCAACHETDSCDQCHRNNTPRNHVAGWGEPRDLHCLTCHFPLSSDALRRVLTTTRRAICAPRRSRRIPSTCAG